MKPDAVAYDWRRDAYLGWLYAVAWQAARGDRVEAGRLWRRGAGCTSHDATSRPVQILGKFGV